ncbi:hypothetical protein FQA39_LY07331 [Lamprigera yunnana]|nr:hypothetical protein FQA39_LY07331 [Lamprigera yunnana]
MPEFKPVVKCEKVGVATTPKLYDRIPARLVLYLLLTLGVTCSTMMRAVMPLAILAMVKDQSNDSVEINYTKSNIPYKSVSYGGTLDWSVDAQYYVLASFYWTYIVTQVIGGLTAQRFGSKITLGFALLATSICNMLIPMASRVHYVLVVVLQLIQGISQGFVWPSIYFIVSCWVPLQERSRFVTCFQGQAIGYTLVGFASGFVIAEFGWSYSFYGVGCSGLLWCLVWYLLSHDKPENHPRIQLSELKYIQQYRDKPSLVNRKVPWRSILCSIPMWAIAITSFGRMWLTSTMMVYGNMLLKDYLGLSIKMNGVFIGISSVGSAVTMVLFSFGSDILVTYNKISLVNNRKLFTGIGHIVSGLSAIMLSYSNRNEMLILAAVLLISLFSVASFSGAMVNIIDISPNFTGLVSGIVQVVLMASSIFAPAVAKTLLINKPPPYSWETIFNVSGWVVLSSYIIYFTFASADVQPWDHADNSKSHSSPYRKNKNQESTKL